jgi:hypothetical protein
MKAAQPVQATKPPALRTKLLHARRATSTWALWLGLMVGILCSFVVLLDWISGAAFHHGDKTLIEALVTSVIVIGFTIDSEVRLYGRIARR